MISAKLKIRYFTKWKLKIPSNETMFIIDWILNKNLAEIIVYFYIVKCSLKVLIYTKNWNIM